MYGEKQSLTGYTGPAEAPSPQKDRRKLEQMLDSLQRLTENSRSNENALGALVDRVLGPVPQAVSQATPSPPSNCIMDEIRNYINILEGIASRTYDYSQRLEQLA